MPQLRFEGSSNDTFGEYGLLKGDYDNCGNGKPIEFLVHLNDRERMVVVGQYCPGKATGWLIGVARACDDDTDTMPNWPMRFELSDMEYSPRLIIDAPDGVTVKCLTGAK